MRGRGFAGMSEARRQEVAAQGGRAAHANGTAHRWTKDTAAVAGRKGGLQTTQRRRERSTNERAS